jgi:hypothetical protein
MQEYIRFQIGRQPQLFKQMQDDLNFCKLIGRRPQLYRQMEDDLNFLSKWETTSII